MYSVDQLLEGVRNPILIPKEIRKQYHRTRNSLAGIDFVDQEWDNLIILDACRYDLFEEANTLPGELSRIRSNASATEEFLLKNFDGGSYGDMVYVSANPHLEHIDAWFYDILRLWESDWDEETGTVLPEATVDRVLANLDDYRNKRVVVHFIQPHRPFLGPTAESIDQSPLVGNGVIRDEPEWEFWWNRLEWGELDRETVWTAYRETLEETLSHVERLLKELPGKSVITSDHGNAFGEDGVYGHPSNTHHDVLQVVPWLEIESGSKSIEDGQATVHSSSADSGAIEDQLEALGYVDG